MQGWILLLWEPSVFDWTAAQSWLHTFIQRTLLKSSDGRASDAAETASFALNPEHSCKLMEKRECVF